MALSELQQARSLLDKAASILITVPAKPYEDCLASLIALYLSFDCGQPPSGQKVDAVSPGHLPSSLQFLAGSSQVRTAPAQQPEAVIDIATSYHVEQIRREDIQGGSRLHLSFPAGATINKDQLELSVRALPYDAVVVVGALDLQELGRLFTDHADFFYNTPVVNIDHRAANEHFGAINLVNITAGSCAEVAYDLISARSQQPLPADTATALYAGIVAGTHSFQKPSTTPRSFQTAAKLIEMEADREAVIQHLIKTKPLELIKLTGAVYTRLRREEQAGIYWAVLEPEDFQDSGAGAGDIPAAAEELTGNIAGFNAAFLMYRTADQRGQYTVHLVLGRGLKGRHQEIQQLLAARKENGAYVFKVTAPSAEEAEQAVHDRLRQVLP